MQQDKHSNNSSLDLTFLQRTQGIPLAERILMIWEYLCPTKTDRVTGARFRNEFYNPLHLKNRFINAIGTVQEAKVSTAEVVYVFLLSLFVSLLLLTHVITGKYIQIGRLTFTAGSLTYPWNKYKILRMRIK